MRALLRDGARLCVLKWEIPLSLTDQGSPRHNGAQGIGGRRKTSRVTCQARQSPHLGTMTLFKFCVSHRFLCVEWFSFVEREFVSRYRVLGNSLRPLRPTDKFDRHHVG
jgi:hypothetical protein